jgi:hypothetical protein
MQRHFFIEGRYLGASTQVLSDWGTNPLPPSVAFCCPACGDIWARFPMDPPTRFSFVSSGCRKHPYPPSEPGGSVWWIADRHMNAAFPDAVLRWELERHLDWREHR